MTSTQATVVAMLAQLARLDRTKVFLGTLAIALVGLFLPGVWGAVLLFAVVAALAALLAQTWSVTPAALRIFRLLVLTGLAVIGATKIF
jgi:hypothetical protein